MTARLRAPGRAVRRLVAVGEPASDRRNAGQTGRRGFPSRGRVGAGGVEGAGAPGRDVSRRA